ncbi:MAG TPA: VOC family protein [Microlunatus sp.]|nr:VOC family protein [Microlunatus sp.]
MTETTGKIGIPAGYTALTPFLCVADGSAAIDFYTSAYGATLVSRIDAPAGGVAHAELDFGAGRLQLSDAMPDFGLAAPERGPATHSVCFSCEDVDAVVARAAALGATIREAPSDFVTGDRYASVIDPFGHRWAIMTRVREVDPEEAERRLAEWAAESLS